MNPTDRATQAIEALLAARAPGRTICPSEAARKLAGAGGDWRALLPEIHAAVLALATASRTAVTQRGQPVDPLTARGPIRLGRPPETLADET